MTILYVAKNGSYINLNRFSKDLKELKDYGNKIYVNLTNKCPCNCTFCERPMKKSRDENSLWLKQEPSAKDVIEEFDKFQWEFCDEIVFCGFGEPLERLEVIIEIGTYLKSKKESMKLRINTIGLGNLIHKRDITPDLKGIIDTVSISLNAPNKEEFLAITRSKYGLNSFDAMLDFAIKCKDYVPNVIMTVVDIIGEDKIMECKNLCDKYELPLRVRPYEEEE